MAEKESFENLPKGMLPDEFDIGDIKNIPQHPALDADMRSVTREHLFDENKQKEIKEYIELTGFPDLEAVSLKILEMAKLGTARAALEAQVTIKFSGYDQLCSVGKNLALPGSDLDGWYIVIDGDESSKQIFYQELIQNLDPQVIDPDSISEVQIVLFSEVMRLGNEVDFKRHHRTQNVALATDILRNEWCIIDNLSPAERSEIQELKLAQQNHFLKKNTFDYDDSLKYKLQKRVELSEKFQDLTQEEQGLVIHILQTINRGEDFDFSDSPENPHLNILWSLHTKEILNHYEKKNTFTAPWLTHAKLKDDDIKKFKGLLS